LIYGLGAALGWGFADFGGAVAGRRIGSERTALVAQGVGAIVVTILFFASGHGIGELAPVAGWILFIGVVSATAYGCHYKALQLGPMIVVSPISATYAVVGVILAVVILGERPSSLSLVGMALTVIGVMLVSTDLGRLRAGTHGRPPGLYWALAAGVLFGVGGFTLGWASKQVGWVPALWGSRCLQIVFFGLLAAVRRTDLSVIGRNPGTEAAAATGISDLIGVALFAAGAAAGFISIVLVASAVFPLVAVVLSILYLHERPVPNQFVGAGVIVLGLLLLGLG
jgi:drug/metabolite transporter (DMT)-like permease